MRSSLGPILEKPRRGRSIHARPGVSPAKRHPGRRLPWPNGQMNPNRMHGHLKATGSTLRGSLRQSLGRVRMMDNEAKDSSTTKNIRARRRLKTELGAVVGRLQTEAAVPQAGAVGDDFLDVAQSIEDQELARLSAARLTQRARRLQAALTRVEDGQYGICSECGASISPKRLLAVPDATTCVACQEQLERVGTA